jgi:uncharacterized protein YaaQ
MEKFNKTLEEVTSYLIGSKDKETVNMYKEIVRNLCKEYHKQKLSLSNLKSQRELLIDFLISTENGVIEKERGKAEVWVDEYLRIN